MKKIFVSIGLAASAAGLSSAFAQSMESVAPKLWNVSGSLRGFYDDNYTASNTKKHSWGLEASPSVSANLDLKQTDLGMRYTFGMYYYFDRSNNGETPLDYTHQADLWLDHAFDETLKLNVTDSFIVAQDPKLVDGGITYRVQGNNVANHAKLSLTKDWTRQFSTDTHYANDVIIYSDSTTEANAANPGSNPSPAALLNRMEQKIGTDFQWHFEKETMGFVGYQFAWTRYSGNQQIALPQGPYQYWSDSRDNTMHYIYIGAQHEFSPNLSGMARGGVNIVKMDNDPAGNQTSTAPYADINATYTFMPGSYLTGGFTQDISATSVASPGPDGQLTQYQRTSVFYMNLTHQFDAKLTGSLVGQYIYSNYKDGAYDNQGDNEMNTGVNLTYAINRNFSAMAGYNFDELFSNIDGRGYSRNRVYLGLNASY